MFSPTRRQGRLCQWDGRRHSSRKEGPVLGGLWRWPVLFRLAPVLVTAVAVTCLASWWSPPLPFRVGEIYPRDLRVVFLNYPLPGHKHAE